MPALKWNHIQFLPIIHGTMEFAAIIRKTMQEEKFDAIAVELPSSIKKQVMDAVSHLPKVSVLLYEPEKNNGPAMYLPIEPCDPLMEAIRTAKEQGISVEFIDAWQKEVPFRHELCPDPSILGSLPVETVWQEWKKNYSDSLKRDNSDSLRESHMASRLNSLNKKYKNILAIMGFSHVEPVLKLLPSAPPPSIHKIKVPTTLYSMTEDSCAECLCEMPLFCRLYEAWRSPVSSEPKAKKESKGVTPTVIQKGSFLRLILPGKTKPKTEKTLKAVENTSNGIPSRKHMLEYAFARGAEEYCKKNEETLSPWQVRTISDYCYRYSAIEKSLLPDFFQLVNTCKGIVDDDLAWEIFDFASKYPVQAEKLPYASITVTADQIFLNTRKISFQKRIPDKKKRKLSIQTAHRKQSQKDAKWDPKTKEDDLCSWPVEDVRIESFGTNMQKRGESLLSYEMQKSEVFQGSFLDGIDFRETLRNAYDKKIRVREFKDCSGLSGSVVVIFDEDKEDKKYPYKMTWLGEHAQESDMAFYASDFKDNLVGPGIGKAVYGGFVLVRPNLRLYDVWTDPDYLFIANKHEKLLCAGLEYSLEPYVIYIAPNPPKRGFHQLAARMNKKIIYLPLGSFSPQMLKKLRTVHVLCGHEKRDIMNDYVQD
jgi:hypothetical protein